MLRRLLNKIAAVVLGLLGTAIALIGAAFVLISSIASMSLGGLIALLVFVVVVVVELFNKD